MNNEAVYNIGVVARMTGIPENTLRVWERRYDFPDSSRTDGGHRLYSPREVARIQWVKQRIDEGMQTRNAIRALEQVEQEGRFPDALAMTHPVEPTMTAGDVSSEALIARLYQALTAHNEALANQIMGEALATYSIEDLITSVFVSLLALIGQSWEEGKLSVATEHFATNHLRRQLLMWMQTAPPSYPVRPIVLACAPGELHEGGLIMLGVLLRRLRWPIIYLGQSIDLPDLAGFIDDLKPAVIVFAAMSAQAAEALKTWPDYLAEQTDNVTIGYGGYIFTLDPDLTEEVPGTYLGDTLAEGVNWLDTLMHDLNPLVR